ncbi:hypothetical protein HDU90_005144 [Geranomyces variabilis]|nr:hypothetical protein HDU90_005144 [Geranomyces variabilis]
MSDRKKIYILVDVENGSHGFMWSIEEANLRKKDNSRIRSFSAKSFNKDGEHDLTLSADVEHFITVHSEQLIPAGPPCGPLAVMLQEYIENPKPNCRAPAPKVYPVKCPKCPQVCTKHLGQHVRREHPSEMPSGNPDVLVLL